MADDDTMEPDDEYTEDEETEEEPAELDEDELVEDGDEAEFTEIDEDFADADVPVDDEDEEAGGQQASKDANANISDFDRPAVASPGCASSPTGIETSQDTEPTGFVIV